MSADHLELMARVPLFSELSREELERISRVAIPRSFPAGVRVFHEGDRSDACYLVRSGDLRVTREHPDGRAIALATLGPGDLFGELAMLDGEARSASVETLTDSELLALPAADVRRLLADHPEISVKLIGALTKRLRETNERVARQSFQTVPGHARTGRRRARRPRQGDGRRAPATSRVHLLMRRSPDAAEFASQREH